MKKLYYVRHGETVNNAAGLLSGRIETPLTDNGRAQARAAGHGLKQQVPRVDLIVCSPYSRTQETARIIAEQLGYRADAILANELLVERSFGELEGTLGSAFLDTHSYADFDTVEGAETVEQLQRRAEQALAWLRTLAEEVVVVVGHGAFGRAIVRAARGLPYTDEYRTDTSIANAAIVELQ